jgi:hypothetical protein
MVARGRFYFGRPDLNPAGNTHCVRVVQKYHDGIFVNCLRQFKPHSTTISSQFPFEEIEPGDFD